MSELQDGLSDLQEQLRKILVVVQGEQERASAIEKSIASDHATILELDQRVASGKSFREKDLLTTNMHRKDINALEFGLAEACKRLDAHDVELDVVRSRLLEFERSADAGKDAFEGIAIDLVDIRQVQALHAQESLRMASLTNASSRSIEKLETLLGEVHVGLGVLQLDHDRTTSSHQDLSRSLEEMTTKVHAETLRLSDACCQLSGLEHQGVATVASTTDLHTKKDQIIAQLDSVVERVVAATSRMDALETEFQRVVAVERGHSQQLDDANRHIHDLDASGREMAGHLKQMRADLHDFHATLRKREEQTVGVVKSLATVNHNMKIIDEQVLDVQTMLRASDPMAIGC